MTRGLHEITRLGVALGAEESTFRGLAGMGDLVLTCTGGLSRNRRVGQRLGRNWTHNYEWRLDTDYEGVSGRVRITDFRGTEYVFSTGGTSNSLLSLPMPKLAPN